MKISHLAAKNFLPCIAALIIFFIFFAAVPADSGQQEEMPYSLSVMAGQMTTNHWEDFFGFGERLNFEDSYLLGVAVARRIGAYKKKLSFEVEGQVVKHFHIQDNWEFNAAAIARWEAFWWDDYIDTSLAFGLGPSLATAEPALEKRIDGDTSRFLVYWMMELSFGLPRYPRLAFITRLHHRSEAFGLAADNGGSNSLAIGLKYRF